jgi:hypothetical protein
MPLKLICKNLAYHWTKQWRTWREEKSFNFKKETNKDYKITARESKTLPKFKGKKSRKKGTAMFLQEADKKEKVKIETV